MATNSVFGNRFTQYFAIAVAHRAASTVQSCTIIGKDAILSKIINHLTSYTMLANNPRSTQ
jgi:hypothetical protein